MAVLLVAGLFLLLSTPSIVIACQQRRRYSSWREWLHGSAQSEIEQDRG